LELHLGGGDVELVFLDLAVKSRPEVVQSQADLINKQKGPEADDKKIQESRAMLAKIPNFSHDARYVNF
jgi:hypothetical protein